MLYTLYIHVQLCSDIQVRDFTNIGSRKTSWETVNKWKTRTSI